MFETTMKAVVLAKKLRARLAEIKKTRPAKLKAYDVAVAKWKRDMITWTKSAVETRVMAITKAELQANEGRYRYSIGFDAGSFFKGAPQPPRFPDDKQQRAIQRLLRQLAITGQETVRFTGKEVEELFTDEGGSSD